MYSDGLGFQKVGFGSFGMGSTQVEQGGFSFFAKIFLFLMIQAANNLKKTCKLKYILLR